ncbi:MAG: hypothetical protein CM15mV97_090 [Caudoviricetes sp.]|nr:MAG: hypothetical protein CM15mV97_090 [Caudoviricetes sp.]
MRGKKSISILVVQHTHHQTTIGLQDGFYANVSNSNDGNGTEKGINSGYLPLA